MSSKQTGKRKKPKGTHGSLTKAGKVRHSTPRIESSFRKGISPIRKNRYKFMKMNRLKRLSV